ncbi:MAG: cation transporter, partial [Candidatus Peregrinibacteria bacterium]|nr:cation transporter [Candidatus Peregrinibacteria bacterium]
MKKMSAESSIKIAFFVAVFLAVLKTSVALLTGSLAVFASALDSLFDSFSSAGNFWAVKKSKSA